MSPKPLLLAALCFLSIDAGAANFFDNFDSYPAGSQMHGLGGWKGWDNFDGAGALLNSSTVNTAPNSVTIEGGSDLVHQFTGATSGLWTFSLMQFVPSTSAGDSYIILLNNYTDGGPDNWSMDVHMDMGTNLVISDEGGGGPREQGDQVQRRAHDHRRPLRIGLDRRPRRGFLEVFVAQHP